MQVHSIHGSNVREALERARDELGGGAVVVARARSVSGGVVLAVARSSQRSDSGIQTAEGTLRYPHLRYVGSG